ncbi:hypothetical protein QJS10_CPA09g01074 [Acorus calamus]|uniref:Reverse transcriptase zinc-binding domain-containing protein n=1 Tax=Acorus calamus TaxID=4465 RepID=A0AAV9E440_ACOCL|nr:hypothetical protein QJS10_CPA09g01074 [Acorus calamus]
MWGKGVDTLIWPQSISGSLSSTKAWQFLITKGTKPKWAKWIWKKDQPPKFSAYVWRAFHGKTPTLELLQTKGLVRDTTYPLYQIGSESSSPLFLTCSFSVFLWTTVLNKMGVRRVQHLDIHQFVEWLDQTFLVGVPRALMQVGTIKPDYAHCTTLFSARISKRSRHSL